MQDRGQAALTLSMLPSLLGESGVVGTSLLSSIPAAAGVVGVLAGRLLDLRCRDSRLGGLSPLLRGIMGVTRSSCVRHLLNRSGFLLTLGNHCAARPYLTTYIKEQCGVFGHQRCVDEISRQGKGSHANPFRVVGGHREHA